MLKNIDAALRISELKMAWRPALTLVFSTLLVIEDHYQALFPEKWLDHVFIFFVVPVLIIKLIFREPLSKYGFRLGDWKIGLFFCLIGTLVMWLILPIIVKQPDFQAYYLAAHGSPIEVLFKSAMDLIGWEFVFRGWLLFTLIPICGPYAVIIQAIPFSIAHFGKPELETLSCILGGSFFGYLSWRTKSYFFPFLLHLSITTLTILLTR